MWDSDIFNKFSTYLSNDFKIFSFPRKIAGFKCIVTVARWYL